MSKLLMLTLYPTELHNYDEFSFVAIKDDAGKHHLALLIPDKAGCSVKPQPLNYDQFCFGLVTDPTGKSHLALLIPTNGLLDATMLVDQRSDEALINNSEK